MRAFHTTKRSLDNFMHGDGQGGRRDFAQQNIWRKGIGCNRIRFPIPTWYNDKGVKSLFLAFCIYLYILYYIFIIIIIFKSHFQDSAKYRAEKSHFQDSTIYRAEKSWNKGLKSNGIKG